MAKHILSIPINELISDIKMGTKHFAEKLKEESGIDGEKEELLGVDNIFKVVDLERELKIRDIKLEEKDHLLEKKDHLLEAKEAELEEERKLREEETKLRKETEKENKRLKAQLKEK